MARFRTAVLAFTILTILAAPRALSAQEPQLPPGTTPEEAIEQIDAMGLRGQLLERIRSSGMSEDQVRRELARRGYDPSILDPYLDETRTQPPAPNAQVISAAQALGALQPVFPDSLALDSLALDSLRMDSMAEPMMPDSSALERERGLRVFGLEVFRRGSTQFEPLTTGPVPPGYTIGPGDELILMLTGDVEQSYTLPVTRDGFVVIPQVGQVWVNGLTLGEVRNQLYAHLGRAYSGVRRGPEATTQFQLSLGQLRPNQVFVAGQVRQPGAYLVGSVASALNALYHAGGPTPNGSFRDLRIMRDGEMAERLDLYEYLVQGDNLSQARLQPGDVVFVPTPHGQVSIAGEVIRPAIYEMLPDETLLDLIEFAGGLTAAAHLRQARITRILPPQERTVPGLDRRTITVDLAEAIRNPASAPRLQPGDAVQVFPVRSEVRRTVSAEGGVWHEGTFAFQEGMRLWDLIGMAEGLRDDAYTGRAQILRLDPQDSTMSVVPVSLERDEADQPVDNPVLREFDTIRVFAESRFTTPFPVTITGEVREPVTDTFADGMTLRDLILRAGGLQSTADLTVEVSRLAESGRSDEDQIARIFRVRVDSSYFVSEQDRRHYLGAQAPDNGAAAEFLLQPYDRVMVRPLPDFEFQRAVKVAGEVQYPGEYTLERRDERLSSILARAGGLTSTAYTGGFRLFRDSTLVSVDLATVLEEPGSREDLVLLPGDSMMLPEYNPVVLVTGAVNAPEDVAVLYRQGAGLDYYIRQAGGYASFADPERVHIRYANGEGATIERVLLFNRKPTPRPGSTITVPALRDEDRINWPALVGDVAQVAGALTTVLLLISRL